MADIRIAWNDKGKHVVACPIVFILLNYQDWPGGVFKVVKNDHFLVFSSVFVHFPSFWVG